MDSTQLRNLLGQPFKDFVLVLRVLPASGRWDWTLELSKIWEVTFAISVVLVSITRVKYLVIFAGDQDYDLVGN